jgi:hypothetical protein
MQGKLLSTPFFLAFLTPYYTSLADGIKKLQMAAKYAFDFFSLYDIDVKKEK